MRGILLLSLLVPTFAAHADPPCVVQTAIIPKIQGGKLHLALALTNTKAFIETLTLHGSCPGGYMHIEGLPTSFDPFGTCTMGACVQPQTARVVNVPPGGVPKVIAEGTLSVKGEVCSPALPEGDIILTAVMDPSTAPGAICTGPAIHLVNEHGHLRQVAAAPAK